MIVVERKTLKSIYLKRPVLVDCYLPVDVKDSSELSLLVINDGQDLHKMKFDVMLNQLITTDQISPVLCIGVHAGEERMMEYGTAGIVDFKGRGAKSDLYQRFITVELLPFIQNEFKVERFKMNAIAGFSLGGLSAIDTLWEHPDIFSVAGVFSGALWWRSKDVGEGYKEETDRIIHKKVREGRFVSGLRFYFATGSLDETADRNGNGIIDSIDDTLGLIEELKMLGYNTSNHIRYINDEEGKHDVLTWGKAMPEFLLWGWGKK